MYSYADALRYVLREQRKELSNLEENLHQSKIKELIGYAKFNMWVEINSFINCGEIRVPETEIDEITSDISDNWIHKNQDLQDIYLKKIEICERQIRWLESQIPYYDSQEMKSKEQRDKEFEEYLKRLNPEKTKEQSKRSKSRKDFQSLIRETIKQLEEEEKNNL